MAIQRMGVLRCWYTARSTLGCVSAAFVSASRVQAGYCAVMTTALSRDVRTHHFKLANLTDLKNLKSIEFWI